MSKQSLEQTIDRWGKALLKYQREGFRAEAEQLRNWLFGASLALLMTGHEDLGRRAGDASCETLQLEDDDEQA